MTKRGRLLATSAVGLLLLAVVVSPGIPAQGETGTSYLDRTTFEAALGTAVTDDYSSPTYPAGYGVYDDATFSGFFGETDYHATGFGNINVHQPSDDYCAGCNGSFLLSFQTTSVTLGGTGVYGVGLDILENDSADPYYAFITFGDQTTEDIPLPAGASFFGVTARELIVSIHFGLEKGGSATEVGNFIIDNLTIGGQFSSYIPLCLNRAGG